MIEIFLFNKKWRAKITNETLEFENSKEMEKAFSELIKLKEKFLPYK